MKNMLVGALASLVLVGSAAACPGRHCPEQRSCPKETRPANASPQLSQAWDAIHTRVHQIQEELKSPALSRKERKQLKKQLQAATRELSALSSQAGPTVAQR